MAGRTHLPRQTITQGTDQATRLTRSRQQLGNKAAYRGLAIGTRYPDQLQIPARIVKETGCKLRQNPTDVLHFQHDSIAFNKGTVLLTAPQQGNGTTGQGIGLELPSVLTQPGQGHKQGTRA